MGTSSYANLFMADLEERLLADYHTKSILWRRYLDDIFVAWPGDRSSFEEFMRYLNSKHHTIKFTCDSSDSSVDFLDLTIYKGSRFRSSGKLDIKPFFKHTNKFQYLQYNSAHPRKLFGSLVKGEMIRLLRACSDEQQYEIIKAQNVQTEELSKTPSNQGHEHCTIQYKTYPN